MSEIEEYVTSDFDQRKEQIERIGVAERNSTAARIVISGVLPDGREVQLFFARRRGFGKQVEGESSMSAPYTHLGGAAKFESVEQAVAVLSELPKGKLDHSDGTEGEKTWRNGYELQEGTDARVNGFETAEAEAQYELQVAEIINFDDTMRDEIREELGDELYEMKQKASGMFDSASQPMAWGESPNLLVEDLLSNKFETEEVIVIDRNRDSSRDPNKPQLTHTVILSQNIKLDNKTLGSLVDSGHLSILDSNTRRIDSPIIAVPVDYLENNLVPSVKEAVATAPRIEDIPLDVAFGQRGQVKISAQLANL